MKTDGTAQIFGIELDLSQQLTSILTATLASIGTTVNTTVNITGDAACSVCVDTWERKRKAIKAKS